MRQVLVVVLATAAFGVVAAPAAADVYCVAPASGCDGAHSVGTVAAGLAAAAVNANADTVQLGAATYSEDDLRYDGAGVVTLVGAGRDQTTIQRATPLDNAYTLSGFGRLNLRSLRVRLIASSQPRAFSTQGKLFEDLRIDAAPGVTSPQGAYLNADEALLRDSEIELPLGGQCVFVSVPRNFRARVEDVHIDGCSSAVRNGGGGLTALVRLFIESAYGVDSGAGDVLLDDSLLLIGPGGTGASVALGTPAGASLVVRQTTIVGRGSGDGVVSFNHAYQSRAQVVVYDTIVRGFGQSVVRDGGAAGQFADIELDFVSYDRDTLVSTGPGNLVTTNAFDDPDPRFLDPAAGDYRLAADSPLVDQDAIPLFFNEPETDYDGSLRIVNDRRDLGAFERAFAPAATTGSAAAIGLDTATIPGALDTGGALGTWRVLYGPTAAYGSATAPQALPAAIGPQTVGAVLSGLSAGTGYHYAVELTTVMGTATGADGTFTTTAVSPPPPPPTPGPNPGPGPGPSAVPVLTGLRLVPATFVAPSRGPTLAVASAPRARVWSVGSQLRFTLSADATVAFTVKRKLPGVRSGRRCLAPRRGRVGRRCTRELQVGRAIQHAARAGATRLRFSGRVGGRALALGSYVLVAQPVGGAPQRVAFRIVQPR